MKLVKHLIVGASLIATAYAQDNLNVQVKLVSGAPFSAIVVTQTTQTLAGGNQINHTTTATIARDSEGRTRRDQTLPNGSAVIFLQDPVSGLAYVLNPSKKTGHKYQVVTAAATPPESATLANTGENLGTQTIEGVQAEGTRLTRTLAPKEGGNEQALQVTTEVWYSNDLQTVISRKTTYPRTSDTTYRLTNIQRAEPDHSLFQVSADYTVTAEQIITSPK